jgi:ribosomal protein L22
MAEEEQEKPKRRRRRSKADEAETAHAAEVTPVDEAARPETPAADAEDEATRAASSTEAASEQASDTVDPTPEDVEAEEATEVVLEADDEAEESDEAVVDEAPNPARRRRRGAAQAEEADAPAEPAPSRRRSRERPAGPPPVVRAQAKYVRSSARKARLVCDHIRGKTVEEARAILALTPRAIARDWSKLLESAVANAEHNHELVGEDLYVKAVHADEGPTIKRFRPRAMGRATRIRKRTSHLTILLTPKE